MEVISSETSTSATNALSTGTSSAPSGRSAVIAKERAAYTYLDTGLLLSVMNRLAAVRAPRYGDTLSFSVSF